MSATNRRAIKTLNALIAASKDGEDGYRCAAEGVGKGHGRLKELFSAYSEQRARFVAELVDEVHRLDVPEQRKGTKTASIHRGWMHLRSVFPGRDGNTLIAERERGERAALKDYEAALKRDMPPETHALVEKHYLKLCEAHERMLGMKAIATLDSLIATCKDGQMGYENAASEVKEEALKELFKMQAAERARFVADLDAMVARLGDESLDKRSFAALLHRGFMKTKAAFTRGEKKAILEECERGERLAARRYAAALNLDLPKDIRELLEGQYEKIKEAQLLIRGLLVPAMKTGE
jgi:uncharacterized protein (TIGR02284 family)